MTVVNDNAKSREELLVELYTLRSQLALLTWREAPQDFAVQPMPLHASAAPHKGSSPVAICETLKASQTAACDLESRWESTDGLRQMLAIINSTCSVDDSLHQILVLAARLLNADAGTIYRLHAPERLLRIRAVHGLGAEAIVKNVPVDMGPIGHAIRLRRPLATALNIADMLGPSPTGAELEQSTGWTMLAQRYATVLVVPLIIRNEVYGAIALYQHTAHTFSDAEIQLAVAFGDHAALVIENARLFVVAHDTAALEERQRLAYELHDSVSQALYVVKLYAEAAARRLVAGDAATAAAHLREVRCAVQEALQEMRLLIFELRPPILEQEGLAAAIQARLDGVEARTGVQTRLTVDGDYRPAAAVEQALYRIAQEALNNALKHAHAHRISVLLKQEPQRTLLMVVDDGIGFDPTTGSGGLGLSSMEARLAQLGGQFMVESSAGKGTVIRAEVGS